MNVVHSLLRLLGVSKIQGVPQRCAYNSTGPRVHNYEHLCGTRCIGPKTAPQRRFQGEEKLYDSFVEKGLQSYNLVTQTYTHVHIICGHDTLSAE